MRQRSKCCGAGRARLPMIGAVVVLLLDAAIASERFDTRTIWLQRDLHTLRAQVERAPRASSFDLKDLERRLHGRRLAAPRDSRLQELELEARRLRWQADRAASRRADAPRGSAPMIAAAPVGRPGTAHIIAAAPPERSYLGQRLVLLQRTVAEIEARLDAGDTTAAARLLETARADLVTLRSVFDRAIADDPNIVALDAQIKALGGALSGR